MDRRQFGIGLAAGVVSAGVGVGTAMANPSEALLTVINGPQRSAAHKARDPFRRPGPTLDFWGLDPGQTVIEISPGSGYWTEILAPYLKSVGGKYIATAGTSPAAQAFKDRYADPAVFGQIGYTSFGATSPALGEPESADMVITARNIHNWMWTAGLLEKALKDFAAVLRRGGILAVEEHRADPRAQVEDARDGYVSTAFVVDEAIKAGFALVAASEVNANPLDTKNHPFGVWTLPPTRRTSQPDKPTPAGFDPQIYEAIGESDRMTLRFHKM